MSEDGILYGNDIRQKLINGANKLTDAVASTLGPRGQKDILYRRGADPVITKDGVTVARVVELDDDYEQAAVEVLRQAALETERTSGDGTTTSTVLARAILISAHKHIAAGAASTDIKRGIQEIFQNCPIFNCYAPGNCGFNCIILISKLKGILR